VRLTDQRGVTFGFDPGSPCLELAHTGGPGWRAPFASLHTPADLAAYLVGHLRGEAHAGPGARPTGDAADHALAGAPARPPRSSGLAGPVTAGDLAAVVALRDAVWGALDARMAGRALPAGPVATINAAAAEPPVAHQITPDGERSRREPVTVGQLAASFARDAVDLLTDPDAAARLRVCGGDTCHLVFLDTSRPGRRRWCSMERCGNRAKARNFRHRSHQSATEGHPS
jgi:predicted RNA-binding Zn ribbon-like protein